MVIGIEEQILKNQEKLLQKVEFLVGETQILKGNQNIIINELYPNINLLEEPEKNEEHYSNINLLEEPEKNEEHSEYDDVMIPIFEDPDASTSKRSAKAKKAPKTGRKK
jgi:hypothetical protein